ncbi:MAG: DUF1566 domain-containing protein [Candidatus Paceibacterota bacterium]
MRIFAKKKGFTLVELLVVIAIIGILAAIVLAYMGNARSKARDARRQSDVSQVLNAQEMYYSDHESYMATGTTEGIPAIGTFLGSIDDPQTDKHYTWLDNTSCDQSFCIYTLLESGKYFAVSEKGSKLLDATPTDGCACWEDLGGGVTQTCSEKGGTCCAGGDTCSSGKISGASDCTECCGDIDNCSAGGGTQTCSEKGGTCCSSGYTCTTGGISGASDCTECCGDVGNCSMGGGGGGEDNKPNGSTCASGSECASSFCVDGYCCNSTCTGSTCQTCGVYSSGGVGTCGYVNSSSQDPDSDCEATGCTTGNCTGSSYACSSGVTPDTSSTIGGDIVYCDEHGRLWTPTRSGSYTWLDALTQCSGLTYANATDWELPACTSQTKDSNCTLYQFGLDACGSYPCAPTAWDASSQSSYYWSSTEYPTANAWVVYFSTGLVNINDKTYNRYVRCVLGQ